MSSDPARPFERVTVIKSVMSSAIGVGVGAGVGVGVGLGVGVGVEVGVGVGVGVGVIIGVATGVSVTTTKSSGVSFSSNRFINKVITIVHIVRTIAIKNGKKSLVDFIKSL